MRKLLLGMTTLLALGGVASADRHGERDRHDERDRDRDRDHRAPVRYEQHREYHNYGGYRGEHYYDRVASRRPIYVQRPHIRERYFDRRVRPRVVVENYAAMDGYTWIAGAWQWNGDEWVWQPGHYEPIANYGYDSGYAPYSPY